MSLIQRNQKYCSKLCPVLWKAASGCWLLPLLSIANSGAFDVEAASHHEQPAANALMLLQRGQLGRHNSGISGSHNHPLARMVDK